MKIRGYVVTAAALLVVAVGLTVSGVRDADAEKAFEPVGRWQSYFNEPGPSNNHSDNTLRNRLVSYIDGAVPGSRIRAHVTRLSTADSIRVVVDALVAAHDRGVDIRMVHNGDSPVHSRLAKRLGDRYVHCETPAAENNTACVSNVDDGTHHMKNWYFSHTELNDNVYKHTVVITSYNITATQSELFNDMLVVSGNKELYDAHVAAFGDYLAQRKTDDRYNQPRGRIFVPSAATYTAGFSPQKRGDMVIEALAGIAEAEQGCELRVANLNVRRPSIIDELVRVKKLGCEVRVVTNTPLTDDNRAQLHEVGIPTRQAEIHNKMMVYNGHYDTPVPGHPKHDRLWVWTGSHNFSVGPLRFRDDVFVGISRKGVYNNYAAHFEKIWASA